MRHLRWTLVAFALALPIRAYAQDDFEAFKKKESERLRAFLTKDDADFADFLKQDWKEFRLSVADKPLVRPKPRATPVAPRAPAPSASPASAPTPARPTAPAPPPAARESAPSAPTPPAAVEPLTSPPTAALPGGAVPLGATLPAAKARPLRAAPAPVALAGSLSALNTTFYGGVVQVPKVDLKLQPLPSSITGEAIGAFWEQINAAPYADVLAALQRQRERMQLGDWAFAQLAFRTGLRLVDNDSNLARLISWHFLIKSGFTARVGYDSSTVFVLLKTDETLYGVSFFTFGSGKFYVLDLGNGLPPHVGSIHTYEKDHPGSTKQLTFFMSALPLLPEDPDSRTLRFKYKDQTYDVKVAVNRNLIGFLSNYPQTRLNGYLDAEVPSAAMDELVDGLRPIVANLSELETVDMILRFVQTAFAYKTDGDQFGREKWMFPEETLFYPYSDCEDRAILFAYLVRKLTPLDVVGLIYSDHVATAVKFSSYVNGDSRMFRGQRYVVSDPTYINASVGMEMEQYKGTSPEIVEAHRLQQP